jgi:hypothetical protein
MPSWHLLWYFIAFYCCDFDRFFCRTKSHIGMPHGYHFIEDVRWKMATKHFSANLNNSNKRQQKKMSSCKDRHVEEDKVSWVDWVRKYSFICM